jgi:hypothetical protein
MLHEGEYVEMGLRSESVLARMGLVMFVVAMFVVAMFVVAMAVS